MLELLWFTVTNLLVGLVVWSAIFVTVSLVIALPMARWCLVIMRRTPQLRGGTTSTRRFLLQAWIVIVLFLLPAGIALFNAVPFAASRGLALIIEDAEPETRRWIVDVITENAAALGVDGEIIGLLTARGSAAVADDLALSLHLAAWGHLITAVMLIAACHVATLLLFWLAVPATPPLAP